VVKPTGFREYDARWLFRKEINLMGMQAAGHGARHADATRLGVKPELVTGPRFPQLFGLDQDGADHRPDERRHQGEGHWPRRDADGRTFAQFALDVPCVAMVTASHNDNGWTGVKMGAKPSAHLRAG
jgi:phosphomannomutase/phosphoglucomutase